MSLYKEGDVLLFKKEDGFSKLIQWYNILKYGHKGYSHAGIIGKVQGTDYLIYEALSQGFINEIDGHPNFYGEKGMQEMIDAGTLEIKRPNQILKDVQTYCDLYLGRGYAWIDIFAIGLSLIGISIKLTGAKKLICSEAVARVLEDCSIGKIDMEKEFNKSFDLITPQDLNNSKFLTSI